MQRTVFFNLSPAPETQQPLTAYPDNSINTGKYSLLTFIPKALFEQFRRLANFFFLAIVILQCFREFSLTNPLFAALPISIIIAVTAVKDGIEDYKRHQSDKVINQSLAVKLRRQGGTDPQVAQSLFQTVLGRIGSLLFQKPVKSAPLEMAEISASLAGDLRDAPGPSATTSVWQNIPWKDVAVGDVIFITNDQAIPADVLVLSTSEPDCICYIETKNLDGETNLKMRAGHIETSWISTPADLDKIRFRVDCELPNSDLTGFNGRLVVPAGGNPEFDRRLDEGQISSSYKRLRKSKQDHNQQESSIYAVTMSQMLLRGCRLRNTSWVVGIVLYTGTDTKLLRNSGETPSKRSLIEKQMNVQVMINFATLLVLCSATAISLAVTTEKMGSNGLPKLGAKRVLLEENPLYLGFLAFWACMILFQNIVPISLYVTTEIVKIAQAFFIYSDVKMYYEPLNAPCTPKTWTIADDLGQIEYLFSDKTGTLTQNVMEFKRCSIAGVVYGEYSTSDEVSETRQREMRQALREHYENPFLSANSKLSLVDTNLVVDMYETTGKQQSNRIRDFFVHLAVCHTVLTEFPEKDNPDNIVYKSQSPDEAALVQGARNLGFVFVDRELDKFTLNILGIEQTFQLLCVLEFTSARRKMSVIVKTQDETIILYTKGADSAIFERLRADQHEMRDKTLQHLKGFANDGLRTLCFGCRVLTVAEYSKWEVEYSLAASVIIDREQALERAAASIEKELVLIGASAIEDKLQDGVPETISLLLKAGIKIWVLTGDKMETAINIGLSCELLSKNTSLIVVKGADEFSVRTQLIELQKCFEKATDAKGSTSPLYALIIEGDTLKYALEGLNMELFVELACKCRSVICCRVSPLQKSQVVATIKREKKAMTLAVGDGANDVSMIHEANVGVGILGLEGRQAVMASDYSIAQFRYLSRLLLVHGKWSYHRVAEMTLLMFYKNLIWTMTLFWYQMYSGWTAQVLVDYFFVLFYNVIYTGLLPVVIGVFDKDVNEAVALGAPQLYQRGIRHELYNYRLFALYTVDGFYQSVTCFFIAYHAFGDQLTLAGHTSSFSAFGTTAALLAITNANLYMGFQARSWTWIHFATILGSPLFIFALLSVYADIPRSSLSSSFYPLMRNLSFWAALLLSVVACQLPRIMIQYVKQTLHPSDLDIMREIQKCGVTEEILREVGTLSRPMSPAVRQESVETLKTSLSKLSPSPTTTDAELEKAMGLVSAVATVQSEYSGMKRRASSLLYLPTGSSFTITGYSFSQEPGLASHLRKLATSDTDKPSSIRRKRPIMQSHDQLTPTSKSMPPTRTWTSPMHLPMSADIQSRPHAREIWMGMKASAPTSPSEERRSSSPARPSISDTAFFEGQVPPRLSHPEVFETIEQGTSRPATPLEASATAANEAKAFKRTTSPLIDKLDDKQPGEDERPSQL